MNSVLILGASGFLGQLVVKKLHEKGFEVGALSKNSIHSYNKPILGYRADILDYNKIEPIISQYNIIINCTGQITNPIHQCLRQNTKGIHNIVRAVKKYNKKLIHFSSVSVYGSSDYVNEDSELNPETAYASIKCFSEYIITRELENSLILRISNIYGENQTKGIMSYLSKQYLSNQKGLNFNNNGKMYRYYLNVDDLSNIVYQLTKLEGICGVYNVIGPCQLTIKELVLKFNHILNCQFSAEYQDTDPAENINTIDNNKIKSVLNYDFKNSVDKYIRNKKNDQP